jgi:16S rRNA G966 N2-methylase RsmD
VRAEVASWLRRNREAVAGSDLCLVDAPYSDPVVDSVLAALGEHPPHLVVCEHHRARRLATRIGGLARVRELNHGLTTLTFLQPATGTTYR